MHYGAGRVVGWCWWRLGRWGFVKMDIDRDRTQGRGVRGINMRRGRGSAVHKNGGDAGGVSRRGILWVHNTTSMAVCVGQRRGVWVDMVGPDASNVTKP
jgi:hypothetical protein